MIRSLLIANRGEIAVRIMRTCKRLGIRTVAVFSDADRDACHVALADTAIRIGPAPARESYLRAEAIISAARQSGAEAIHPGYGFLSERVELPTLCAKAGLVWVGPSADRIAAMGPKIGAKRIAEAAGVPGVPGYAGADQSDARFADAAARIGFPVMVKASSGGGGKGMRRVSSPAELLPALDMARREAAAAFGDAALLIEKLVQRPRHLEVQVAGDKQGNLVHLFERDCSVQRNNQKLLEEAPAPNLADDVRAKLWARGVAVARAIAYDNLGTVEFILEDGADEPWFLEMNTRLQVEHPVTEAITGLDLVEWQIRIACGERLPLQQDAIRAQGHAIEARITAERADHGFRPDAGRITGYREPEGIRIDSGVAAGSEVTLFYDSLLAKVIATGATRAAACARLADGLRDFAILGPATTLQFLGDSVRQPIFAEGRATTRFIDEAFPAGWRPAAGDRALAQAVACVIACEDAMPGPWAALRGFRVLAPAGGLAETTVLAQQDGDATRLTVAALPDGRRRVTGPDGAVVLSVEERGDAVRVACDDRVVICAMARAGDQVFLGFDGQTYAFTVAPEVQAAVAGSGTREGSGVVTAPMPGVIAELCVGIGDSVMEGQVVVVLESMKLFTSLAAAADGVVTEIGCRAGETVIAGARLLTITPANAGERTND